MFEHTTSRARSFYTWPVQATPEQDLLQDLIKTSPTYYCRAEQLLLRQGEPGDRVVIIIEGLVKVERTELNGERSILAFRGPYEFVGRTAVLQSCRHFASVETLQPCKVAVVRPDAYLGSVAERSLTLPVVTHTHGRLIESMIVQGNSPPWIRLAFALVRLASRNWSGAAPDRPAVLHLTRTDLALHLRVSRNTISASLRQLAERGVEASRNTIVITDLSALGEAVKELDR